MKKTVLVGAMCSAGIAYGQSAYIPTDDMDYPAEISKSPALISQCMGCHGPQGQSFYQDWPNLAGQSADYIKAQLHAFKDGSRKDPVISMNVVTQDLSDDDIDAIADYFSNKDVSVADSTKVKAPTQLSACIACHGENGVSTSAAWPNLAGQKETYLLKQLEAFKSGERKNDQMNTLAKNLSAGDIKELAKYYSSFAVSLDK